MKKYIVLIAILGVAGLLNAADQQNLVGRFRRQFETVASSYEGQALITQLEALRDDIQGRINTLPAADANRMRLRDLVKRRIEPRIRQTEENIG